MKHIKKILRITIRQLKKHKRSLRMLMGQLKKSFSSTKRMEKYFSEKLRRLIIEIKRFVKKLKKQQN
ncbi:hypothetical protein UF14_09610 [Bacillus licheniformis]|nr:hypothetical protein UF14_09610 [Bacillus licheniformis]